MWKRLIRSSKAPQNTPKFSARRLCAGVALAGFGAAFAAVSNPENLLRSGFEQAIRNSAEASVTQASRIPVSGSEDYWLTALANDTTLANDNLQPVSKSVTIGDRILMSLGGVEKSLEVASVTEFDPKSTEIDTRAKSVRLVLVTARDANDSRAHPIRFVMEIETSAEQAVTETPAKTL